MIFCYFTNLLRSSINRAPADDLGKYVLSGHSTRSDSNRGGWPAELGWDSGKVPQQRDRLHHHQWKCIYTTVIRPSIKDMNYYLTVLFFRMTWYWMNNIFKQFQRYSWTFHEYLWNCLKMFFESSKQIKMYGIFCWIFRFVFLTENAQ